MSWAVSAFSWTSIAKTKVSRHPVSLIQCGPSSQFVFELVSRDCQPPLPLLLSLSFYLTLHHSFTVPKLYPFAHSFAAVLCARHRAAWHSLRASVDPGCHPPLLLSSFPSLLPSYPRNRETCAGLFMLFL